MGALHSGHRALLDCLRSECASAVCSIFVNPTQFGPGEDLARYPRPLEADLALCQAAGVDAVFLPGADEMYPPGAFTVISVTGLEGVLEGAARPGHFSGVATVVAKLLNIVQPQRAYFGEKDYQQLCVIRRLAADLNLPVEIVACPTVREADGLALSSRNTYLSADERAAAPYLHEALLAVRHTYLSGERDPAQLVAAGVALLRRSRRASFELDYLALADSATLAGPSQAHDGCRVLIAARLGTTRLIDNIPLVEDPERGLQTAPRHEMERAEARAPGEAP
jgi:pantoate--beta-alanine ligase